MGGPRTDSHPEPPQAPTPALPSLPEEKTALDHQAQVCILPDNNPSHEDVLLITFPSSLGLPALSGSSVEYTGTTTYSPEWNH